MAAIFKKFSVQNLGSGLDVKTSIAILKMAAILNFSVVNSDVLTSKNIKIHELHVQIV